jgi:hypothetical protein
MASVITALIGFHNHKAFFISVMKYQLAVTMLYSYLLYLDLQLQLLHVAFSQNIIPSTNRSDRYVLQILNT